jgi:hypothetical protein
MEPSDRALLVFTRSPQAEARAKGLDPEAGTRLFLALLASWEESSRRAGIRLVLATPASCRRWMENSPICRNASFLTQRGGTFGERLLAGAADAMALGFGKLVVVGGDSPAVSCDELLGIFEKLERGVAACVLGPSDDGGVYLVGLGRPALPLLGAMRLRRDDVFERSLEFLRHGGFEVHVLARRNEIDTLEDLERAWSQARHPSPWRPFRSCLADALRPVLGSAFLLDRPAPSGSILRLPARAPPAAA